MIKLYRNIVCPFAQRAAIVAAEKKIQVEFVEVSLPTTPDWYKEKVNPRGSVPTLAVGDYFVHESLPICEYLDATHAPFNLLLPTDPAVRGRIRGFQAAFGNLVGAFFGTLRGADQSAAISKVRAAAATVERLLALQSPGPFFLGAEFSMADVTAVPFLYRFRYLLPAYSGVDLFDVAPRCFQLLLAAEARPSVKSTSATVEQFVTYYRGYTPDGRAPRAPLQLHGPKGDPFTRAVQLSAAVKGLEMGFVGTQDDNVVLDKLGEPPITSTPAVLAHLEDLHAAAPDRKSVV